MGGDCALTRAVDPIVFCCLFWARLCVWGNGASPRAVTSVIFCDPYDGVQGGGKDGDESKDGKLCLGFAELLELGTEFV